MLQVRNARIATNQLVCIQMIGMWIVGITDKPVATTSLDMDFDARGCWVVPGGIDTHIHDRFPGNPLAETIINLVKEALAGGTTTLYKMPNTNPPITTFQGMVENLALIGQQAIDFRAWMGGHPDFVGELSSAADLDAVCGVKVYGSHTTGSLYVPHGPGRYKICERATEKNMIVGVHAQDQVLIEQNRASIDRQLLLTDHCVVQDTEVELSSVRQFLQIQRDTGCILYFCHISSPEALVLIQEAKQRGARVYVEVCTPHISPFDNTWLARAEGWRVKVNPSLRSPEQVRQMRAYVCQPGWVDVIATDHAPHLPKLAPLYDDIPSGMPGVRTRLLVVFDLVARGMMDMTHFVNLTSANAARIFGLHDRGRIAVGARADLAIIDPDSSTLVDDRDALTRCGWSPLHGHRFPAQIRATVAKGQIHVF